MEALNRVLNFSVVSRVRRNHALEHATLQVLAKKDAHVSAAGYSDPGGFYILGNISTDQLHDAVTEALRRLQNGEENLAIHPNCGTNFATTGIVAGSLAWLAMLGTRGGMRDKLERWPLVTMLATLGIIFSQPLGPLLQKYVTTDGDVGELQVTEISRLERQGAPVHRIRTIN
jgi:hypothetical protein